MLRVTTSQLHRQVQLYVIHRAERAMHAVNFPIERNMVLCDSQLALLYNSLEILACLHATLQACCIAQGYLRHMDTIYTVL